MLAFSARARSLAFQFSGVLLLALCRHVLIYFVLIGGSFEGLSLFSDSVEFSFSKGSFFLIFSGLFRGSSSPALFFFLSGSVLSSTPYIGLLCLLRMHAINSCVGDV